MRITHVLLFCLTASLWPLACIANVQETVAIVDDGKVTGYRAKVFDCNSTNATLNTISLTHLDFCDAQKAQQAYHKPRPRKLQVVKKINYIKTKVTSCYVQIETVYASCGYGK